MRAVLLSAALALGLVVATGAQGPARQPRVAAADLPDANPYTSAEDLAIGRRLFEGRCGHCHGQNGEGGRGAVLNTGLLRSGSSDRELFMTIRGGIPNTEMPGAGNLPTRELWRIVSHVRQLGRQGAPEPELGDRVAGAAVYRSSGCAACHRIADAGAFIGPELSGIGARRSLRHLRASLVDPGADIALDYRTVAVVDRQGRRLTGIHLNEDEYSVHLRDPGGNLLSFLKSDLSQITLPRESLMPAYASLPPFDLENLVSYLGSLRGGATQAAAEVWRFDRLDNIGGHPTTVLGQPVIVNSPIGKAVQFDGVDDALEIENHPLAGADAFTFEAIFRPDGGATEQRWFHLSERDPVTGLDTDNRMLFEIRVAGDNWFLDSYNQSGTASKALMNRTALHPLGAWYRVASVYDGKTFANYVDGVQEGAAELQLAPHGAGHASVGMRINRVFYFKGAVHSARFTRRALSPAEFLPAPGRP